jgi:Xaa-Pro aminopeptidase
MNVQSGNLSPASFPTFSLAERDRRWKVAREVMDQENVDVLLVAGDRNPGAPMSAPDTYLTNDRPGAWVVFPRQGEPTIFVWSAQVITAHVEGSRHNEGSWVDPENMRLGKTPAKLADFLRSQGHDNKTIGVVGIDPVGAYRESFFSSVMWDGIVAALPNAKFKSVWRNFSERMMQLGAEEIAALRLSSDAGERMCEAVMAITKPGVSEAEIYAAAMSACWQAGAHTAALILQTGKNNTAWGQPSWTFRAQAPRIIADGDIVMMETFPSYGMIEAQQQLCVAVGKIDPVCEKAAEVARRSYELGLEKLRPGNTFGDVCKAMAEPMRATEGGWWVTPHIHCMNPMGPMLGDRYYNMQYMQNSGRYPTMDYLPVIGGDMVLKPGMTFAFEPNCHIGHNRINIGGTVLVTENGAEELNHLANWMQRV